MASSQNKIYQWPFKYTKITDLSENGGTTVCQNHAVS